MPNRVHAIIMLNGRGTTKNRSDYDEGPPRCIPTEQFGKPIPGSIPTIIRSFKSAVPYRINLLRGAKDIPIWQRNYYEHIIRDIKDWDRIHRYIEVNPSIWAEDDENLLN